MSASNPAETYESYMVPPLFAPSAKRLVDLANPQPGERILDVACGTGAVAREIASRAGVNGNVVGLDLSPDMLAVARRVATRDGLDIEWHEGRAEELPFADGSFDLVLCQYALMFFVDPHAALTEMRRVLTAGGRAVVSVFQSLDRHSFYQTLDAAIERRLGSSGVGDIFALGDERELRALVTGAGFDDVQIEPYSFTARFPNPEAFLAGEIDVDTAAIPAMQHLDVAARRDLTAALQGDMQAALHKVTENDAVMMPFHVYLVRAVASPSS